MNIEIDEQLIEDLRKAVSSGGTAPLWDAADAILKAVPPRLTADEAGRLDRVVDSQNDVWYRHGETWCVHSSCPPERHFHEHAMTIKGIIGCYGPVRETERL